MPGLNVQFCNVVKHTHRHDRSTPASAQNARVGTHSRQRGVLPGHNLQLGHITAVSNCMTANSGAGCVRKRTTRPPARCTAAAADRGSRFLPCPLCGANVPWHKINEHLDTVHTVFQPSSEPQRAIPASEQPVLAEPSQLDPKTQTRYCCDHQPKTYNPRNLSDHLITVCMACRDTGSDVQVYKSTAAGSAHYSHTLSETKPDGAGSLAPQAWWQQPTIPQTLASAKVAGIPRQDSSLTDEQLRSLAPCEVVRNALPVKLANSLLKVLLADCATWVRGTWFMAGKQHSAPRRSAYYTLASTQVKLPSLLNTLVKSFNSSMLWRDSFATYMHTTCQQEHVDRQ